MYNRMCIYNKLDLITLNFKDLVLTNFKIQLN
jgi:hypothetical protein